MKALMKFKKLLTKVLDFLVIVMMAVLVLVVVWQVLARAFNLGGTAICSEVAQFLLIWITLLGGSLGFIHKAHLGVDFFVNKLKGNAKKTADVFAQLCIAFFGAYILFFGGSSLVGLTYRFGEVSSAMNIRMAYVYLALPICGLVIVLVALEAIAELVFTSSELEEEAL